MQKKKIICFDLDGTLAPSKQRLDDEMAELINQLLEKYHVSVIT
jgi:hydroxymethylpyrimidine pyrophosphatase-like HAD family hydrolase